jgi:hypothetical protein
MILPLFENQPNEEREFQPAVVQFLRAEGVQVRIIDGLFDLLLSTPRRGRDSYLELKVRLRSQGRACAISPAQWRLIQSHDPLSAFEHHYRVLIYDEQGGGRYAFAAASELLSGIPHREPQSTAYIRSSCLDGLTWQDPIFTTKILLEWANRE